MFKVYSAIEAAFTTYYMDTQRPFTLVGITYSVLVRFPELSASEANLISTALPVSLLLRCYNYFLPYNCYYHWKSVNLWFSTQRSDEVLNRFEIRRIYIVVSMAHFLLRTHIKYNLKLNELPPYNWNLLSGYDQTLCVDAKQIRHTFRQIVPATFWWWTSLSDFSTFWV